MKTTPTSPQGPGKPHHPFTALLARYAAVARAAWHHRAELAGPTRLTDELAFLPAHLSLQDTPVHPAPRRAAWVICGLFTAALAWSILGEIDVVAVAHGRIIVQDRTKTIQPLDAGVVKAIHVRDGDHVSAGQLLIELDPTSAEADANRVDHEWAAAYAEQLRTHLLLGSLSNTGPTSIGQPAWPAQTPLNALDSAQARDQLATEWSDISAKQAKLQAELRRHEAEVATAEQLVAKLNTTLPLARQREADFLALSAQGFVASHAGQDRTRERIELERDLATAQAQRAQATAGLREGEAALTALRAETLRSLRERNNDATLKLGQLEEERRKAAQHTALTRLTSPVAGKVQQLAVHTTGGVVTPAQALMVIVPDDAEIVAEVMLENKDIGFIHPGQPAEIKIEAFPFTKYGTVPAIVTTVTADAVISQDSNPGKETQPEFGFVANLKLQGDKIGQSKPELNLSPGMALTSEIKIDRRHPIYYFLSPVSRKIKQSIRER